MDVSFRQFRVDVMTTVTIEEAQARLPELIDNLAPGAELVVTRDKQPVAKLARIPVGAASCKAGSAKDKILWIAPDFDAPLDEFREYME